MLKAIWRKAEPWIVVLSILLFPPDINFFSPAREIFVALSYGVTGILLLGHWKKILAILSKDLIFLLLLLLAMFSVMWSITPEVTVAHSRGLLRTTLFGVYMAVRFTPKEQLSILFRVFMLAIVASLVAIALVPSYGIMSRTEGLTWVGIYTFKNGLAGMMLLGISIALSNMFVNGKNWFFLLPVCLLAVVMIVFSRSATSLATLLLIMSLYPVYQLLKFGRHLRVIFYSLAGLFLSVSGFLIVLNADSLVRNLLGRDLTFTGRTGLWMRVLEMSETRPWLGFGYGKAFWNSDLGYHVLQTLGWRQMKNFHSHNGFLELALQLGLIGLGLFLLHFMFTAVRTIYLVIRTKSLESFWMLQLLLMVLVINMSESSTILASGQTLWLVYTMVTFSTVIQKDQLLSARRLRRRSLRLIGPSMPLPGKAIGKQSIS
jgi:exopolysaccharide production protein ExoQ